MTSILLTLVILCAFGVLHTYVIYPWWVVAGARPQDAKKGFTHTAPPAPENGLLNAYAADQLPAVYVLMAAHNEETVLQEKLDTLAAQDYPGPLTILIGSDHSTDRTDDILRARAQRDPRFRPTLFASRQGKPGIINQLAARAEQENTPSSVYLITDASVMLRPEVVSALVLPMLEDERIGVVDSTMIQTGANPHGIGIGNVEADYISREVDVKRAEGLRWGAMIGPFGGCWAIRAAAFTPVPPNFLVDDFFLCMAAYEQGWRGVASPLAVVEEGVGQSLHQEFRRKARISGGNWQNLVRFRKLWFPFWKNPLAFAFFSHKVLRWWTPFLLMTGCLAWMLYILYSGYENNYYFGLLFAVLVNTPIFLLLADFLLSILGFNFWPARYARYFIAMNVALLVGFYRYLTGIKSNVWQPSQRH